MQQPFVRVISAERVIGKDLCRKLRQIYVTPCHRSAYAKLALLTVSDLLAVAIQNISLISVKRSAYGGVIISLIKLKC